MAVDGVSGNTPPIQYTPLSTPPAVTTQEQKVLVAMGLQGVFDHLPPTAQGLLLASIDIAPTLFAPTSTPSGAGTSGVGGTGGTGGTHADTSLDHLESTADLIKDLMATPGNSIDALAALIIKQAFSQLRDAMNKQVEDSNSAKADLLQQAAELHSEASKMREGAIVSLVLTVVASAVTIGFAAKAFHSAQGAYGKAKEGGELLKGDNPTDVQKLQAGSLQNESQALNTLGSNYGQLGQGISGLINGLASFANTMYQADAKDMEAQGSVYAAEAQDQQAQAALKKGVVDAMNKTIDSIIGFLKDMQDQEAQMMASITKA